LLGYNQECQRLSGQWNHNMINELIATVLTDNYIPPIILGEETSINGITRQWIIDGLQRSSSLSLFKYGGTKITQNIDEYMVTYQRKELDGNGNVKRDADNEIIWESVQCDIRNKTYDQLPEELRDRFDQYQIEVVIHQDCDTIDISKLVRKFNNHRAMNSYQKAFTYIENFATDVRRMTENRFFLDIYSGSKKDKVNGKFERIAGNMVLLCNYPDKYKKDLKQQYNRQTILIFLEYANEATAKISEINRLICGTEMPEEGSLLGAIDDNIYFMIETLLSPIVKMEIGDDDLNDMAIKIMHAQKDEIGEIIKGYSDIII